MLAFVLLCLVLLSGCAGGGDFLYAEIKQGKAAEAFDAQAVPALEAGLAEYWYPQSLATVVIAVDRARTDAEIGGWGDLLSAGVNVGWDGTEVNSQLCMAAMAYGLEGEGFTLRGAARLLAGLQSQKLLARDSFDAPVVICFDTQAPPGREIVVPREGTLAYAKGVLSAKPLDLAGEADLAVPGNASRVTDYGHLNTVCQNVTRVLNRQVFRSRLYSSADGREHQFVALLYIVLVVVYIASVVRRATQKGVRRASLLISALLLGWAAVRLLKYQLAFDTGLNRALWYGFYPFQLTLPLVFLWLAWAIDRPEDGGRLPKWLAIPAAVNGALLAVVFTNDSHNWVFRLDLSKPTWYIEYGYGPGYYLVMAAGVAMTLAALAMMLAKARRAPRKGRFAFPLGFGALLAAYGAGYVLRVPLLSNSDITITCGLFSLLLLETAIRAGLIPVNSKYVTLFRHSPLAMRIVDGKEKVVLSSTSGPLRKDDDTLLFAAPIAGGRTLWQEDIGALNRLRREVEDSVGRLTAANAMLAEEERIKRATEEENAKAQLLLQLEAEIAGHTARLSSMIENRESAAGIMLLLCYIKRRCNLFFREREARLLPADELMVYIDELARLAGYAGVKILATSSQADAPIELRRATLLYDFFYSAAACAAQRGCFCILAHLGPGQALRLLPSEGARAFQMEKGLREAAAAVGGVFAVKDLDGAVGISLSFPERGGAYG